MEVIHQGAYVYYPPYWKKHFETEFVMQKQAFGTAKYYSQVEGLAAALGVEPMGDAGEGWEDTNLEGFLQLGSSLPGGTNNGQYSTSGGGGGDEGKLDDLDDDLFGNTGWS